MKQGKADRDDDYGGKVEPTSRAVTPARTNQYGESVAYSKDPHFAGRGFSAPKNVSHTTSNKGSQGRH